MESNNGGESRNFYSSGSESRSSETRSYGNLSGESRTSSESRSSETRSYGNLSNESRTSSESNENIYLYGCHFDSESTPRSKTSKATSSTNNNLKKQIQDLEEELKLRQQITELQKKLSLYK